MKKHLSTIVIILIFLVGLSLLLYPTVSDYWNSLHQSRVITDHAAQVADLDTETYTQVLDAARQYNQDLLTDPDRYELSASDQALYNSLLNISDNGVMGYVEIPAIDVSLPIYHSTAESVLQVAVGHLEGSSLPVGGESTHCVLSGHRGLPSAKLFTDLDQLTVGDRFRIKVLSETLTYEIDQIITVEPDDTAALEIVTGKDLCTLSTCTPYGINTHRLLVQGHRVEEPTESVDNPAEETFTWTWPMIAALIMAVWLLAHLLASLIVRRRANGKNRHRKDTQ